MKRKFHEVEQNTDEWMQLRMGKITASNFSTIMANLGKPFGKPAMDYAMRVAIEGHTKRVIETFTNEWMERGKQLEEDARQLYSSMNFVEVKPGGFAEWMRYGASADGQINDCGLIEIKCVKYNTHFNTLIKGGYDTSYQWQIRGQMMLYDREWCDFVSYCPDFPQNKQLYVHRIKRDLILEDQLMDRLAQFEKLIDSYIQILS